MTKTSKRKCRLRVDWIGLVLCSIALAPMAYVLVAGLIPGCYAVAHAGTPSANERLSAGLSATESPHGASHRR